MFNSNTQNSRSNLTKSSQLQSSTEFEFLRRLQLAHSFPFMSKPPQNNALFYQCLQLGLSQAKFKEEIKSALKHTASFGPLSLNPGLNFNTASTSPSLIGSKIEEKSEPFDDLSVTGSTLKAEDIAVKEEHTEQHNAFKPFTILRQSKKITKEKIYCAQSGQLKETSQLSSIKKHKLTSKKHTWNEQEDQHLRELVVKLGPQWNKIGLILGNKTGKQVRDRYLNSAKEGINFEEWSEEEDKLFLVLLEKHGKKWCRIAMEMPGRTENQVKNKFYCLRKFSKNNSKRRNALKEAIEEMGTTNDQESTEISNASQNGVNGDISPSEDHEEFSKKCNDNDKIVVKKLEEEVLCKQEACDDDMLGMQNRNNCLFPAFKMAGTK